VWENPSQAIETYLKFMIHVIASTPVAPKLTCMPMGREWAMLKLVQAATRLISS
jgi:hypothetical protein